MPPVDPHRKTSHSPIAGFFEPMADPSPFAGCYVDNIFFAKAGDYQKATIKVFDAGPNSSFIELPMVRTPVTQ
jgi:hypothetical protein